MDVTKRNHYNPCFWTALWNTDYYRVAASGKAESEIARQQVVHVLNLKSQKTYRTIVERVHHDKDLGLAEITREAAEDFVRRYHPDQYQNFLIESKTEHYPVYLDFENILSGIEATPPYQDLLKVAVTQSIDNLSEKSNIASLVILQSVRSHAIMNSMTDWHEELGYKKFEHLVTLRWMLSDAAFLTRLVYPLFCSRWTLYTSAEHVLPQCDSPVLVQPESIMVALSPRLLLELLPGGQVDGSAMPDSTRITAEKLDEYRRRTIWKHV